MTRFQNHHKGLLTIIFLSVWLGSVTTLCTAIEPPIAIRYQSFPLQSIHLLESPFKRAQDLNRDVLLQLDPDRLLAPFLTSAGLPSQAEPYGGWESSSILVPGQFLGHYLSASASLLAIQKDKRTLQARIDTILTTLKRCQDAHGDGYVLATPNGKVLYRQMATGQIQIDGFHLNGMWTPLYTAHKLFAGLRDLYRQTQDPRALAIARKLGEFFLQIFAHVSDGDMQRILAVEHGGMMEVFVDLSVDTGDARFLGLASRFHHQAVLDPLIAGKDILSGHHANTQIPKFIGLARLYEQTGLSKYRQGVRFFWDRVVEHHSYCTGSCSEFEYFWTPDQLNHRLSYGTGETCAAYNMLKLTQHLFHWDGRMVYADYYERTLVNHILGSQHPSSGWLLYYFSLAMGGGKNFQNPRDFSCCMGTGLENHMRYSQNIYYHNERELVVNLLVASRLDWQSKGLVVVQESSFPETTSGVLSFQCDEPVELTVKLRYPGWAKPNAKISINDQPILIANEPGSYLSLQRTWQDGDRILYAFDPKLTLEPLPDNPQRAAFRYGPLVLAGNLESEVKEKTPGPTFVPVLVPEQRPQTEWLTALSETNCFRLNGIGRPHDVDLKPLYQVHEGRYTVYWDILLEENQWQQRKRELRDLRAQQHRIENRTVDCVYPGLPKSETAHNLQHQESESTYGPRDGYAWRRAYDPGWFSYDMQIKPNITQSLRMLYKGNENYERRFKILVNGEKIAEQTIASDNMSDFFHVTYPLPKAATRGKSKITICFQPHPRSTAGSVYEIRVME